VNKRRLVIFATAGFVISFAYERQRVARTKILAGWTIVCKTVSLRVSNFTKKSEQRVCQTMSMCEKSKNVRNRRVLDVAAWPSDRLRRRMRDHLAARAEMSALS
jgi:hypothetical protein